MLELIAPESYKRATPEELAKHVNGCGPAGWRIDLVPDSLLGLEIGECCRIHDWLYYIGGGEQARLEADIILYQNLVGLILQAGGPLRPFRMAAAATFYIAVRERGAEFFGKAA